jgi:hypothetical protein
LALKKDFASLCPAEMARIGHLVEIAIGREAAMICIGNGHRETEVSGRQRCGHVDSVDGIADHVNYGVHFGHDGVPIRGDTCSVSLKKFGGECDNLAARFGPTAHPLRWPNDQLQNQCFDSRVV